MRNFGETASINDQVAADVADTAGTQRRDNDLQAFAGQLRIATTFDVQRTIEHPRLQTRIARECRLPCVGR